MLEYLGNAILSARQKACEAILKSLINQRIEKFGQVTQLEIDAVQKKAQIQITLKGEQVPIDILVDSYQLQSVESQLLFSVQKVRTSREWITAALEEFVVGRQFAVPEAARLAL